MHTSRPQYIATLRATLSSIAENRFAEFGELSVEEGVEFNLTACGERVRVPITQDQIAMLATISKREKSSRDSSHFPHASWATLDPSSVQLQGSGASFIFVDLW